MHFQKLLFAISLGCSLSSIALAQPDSAAKPLTLEQIMADPDWIARQPERPRWSFDGQSIFYQRKQKGSDVREWFCVDPTTAKSTRVPLRNLSSAIPSPGDFDADHSKLALSRDGDLFIRDLTKGSLRQLTKTAAIESGAAFLRGGQRIQFRRDGALLIRDLRTGLESEPVVVKFEDAPPKDKKPVTEFVARREQEMFEYLQRQEFLQNSARDADKLADEANTANAHPPVYVGKGLKADEQMLSDNSRWLAVVVSRSEGAERGRRDRMPVWVGGDGYIENRDVRSLVGNEPEPPQQLKLIDVQTRKVIDIDLSELPEIAADRLAFLRKADGTHAKAATDRTDDTVHDSQTSHNSHAESPANVPSGRQPRPVTIQSVRFSADSKFLLLQCFSTDNKDRWIVSLKLTRPAEKESIAVLHHRFDEAWIGPNDIQADWINDTSSVWFVSEKSGYAHLSVADAATGEIRTLTDGTFEVSSPQTSRDGTSIFFTSNETHPGIYELWTVDVTSGVRRRLTELGGVNEFTLSYDEQSAVAVHSEATRPPELVVVRLTDSVPPKTLTRTTTKDFRSVKWTLPRFVRIPSRHGGDVHSRVYLPEDAVRSDDSHDASDNSPKLRPAVMFVHGAGYLQNAHQGWSGYFREFMFHTLLTRKGYVVLDMDYRASAGYGRDWRTAIYRRMGTPELEDLADGVEWLVENHQVDSERIGVYGGSYGGFLTLMSLFREPDLFACGAALRPVTDWAHYNHGYTSNILNTPDVDPEAYNQSSPINFAEGLQNPLLICHGMVDDNVFFKDTVRLTQRLIELKKDNWTTAMYPVEPHAFRQPSSWRDEYQRILDLFERELAEVE